MELNIIEKRKNKLLYWRVPSSSRLELLHLHLMSKKFFFWFNLKQQQQQNENDNFQ